jgi:cysteine desulfurase
MKKGLIYLDHAATTPMDIAVHREMGQYCCLFFGNPATLYSLGRKSNEAVEQARAAVARMLGCSPDEVYFTSGGTESDNWALQGIAFSRKDKGKHIITSNIEHHAILDTAEFLEKIGFEVTRVPVDSTALIDPDDVRKAIRKDTILISIMHANNEVGTIEPVAEIGKIAKEAGIPFHTDAVQSVGKIPTDVNALGVDLLSMSAHKFYGPKGVGAMYLRKGTRIQRFMHGGGQERNKRAGTHNVQGIVGLGAAAKLASEHRDTDAERLRALAKKLRDGLVATLPDIRVNGNLDRQLPGMVHVCVDGIEGEAMLLCLDGEDVCVSSGSACTTGSLDPSHVLLAMGMPAEVAHGSVRFTIGRHNTEEEIDRVLEVFPPIVEKLRRMSPTYKRTTPLPASLKHSHDT